MRLVTLLACCTLSFAGAVLAQPTESPNRAAQGGQESRPQDQHPSVRTEQATPPAAHTGSEAVRHYPDAGNTPSPASRTADSRTSSHAARDSDATTHERSHPPARTAHVARASHAETCAHQADTRHLTGSRRSHFLAGCHPDNRPR